MTIEKLKAATQVASDELLSDQLNWIRESSLRERAYFIGLVIGLGEFAKEGAESDYLNKFLTLKLLDTLYTRSADDNFSSTKTGAYFEKLRECTDLKNHEESSILEAIESLRIHIEELERKWSNQAECAKIILGQSQSVDEIAKQLHKLENILRIISTIEMK